MAVTVTAGEHPELACLCAILPVPEPCRLRRSPKNRLRKPNPPQSETNTWSASDTREQVFLCDTRLACSEGLKLEVSKLELERAGLQTEITLLTDQLHSRDIEIRQLEQEAYLLSARLSKATSDYVSKSTSGFRFSTHLSQRII